MKIVPQTVQLEAVTVPARIVNGVLRLESGNGATVIERAGRTCYKSEDKMGPGTAGPFVAMLKSKHHGAMLEHASCTFRIVCDRGVSHEIVRHRLASYAQESTRYCDYTKGKFDCEVTFVQPPDLDGRGLKTWTACMKVCEWGYKLMRKIGIPAQIARSVLPNSLKTEIVMTTNFREWLHFLSLRTAQAAHPQMREVARMVEEQLWIVSPEVFADSLAN